MAPALFWGPLPALPFRSRVVMSLCPLPRLAPGTALTPIGSLGPAHTAMSSASTESITPTEGTSVSLPNLHESAHSISSACRPTRRLALACVSSCSLPTHPLLPAATPLGLTRGLSCLLLPLALPTSLVLSSLGPGLIHGHHLVIRSLARLRRPWLCVQFFLPFLYPGPGIQVIPVHLVD